MATRILFQVLDNNFLYSNYVFYYQEYLYSLYYTVGVHSLRVMVSPIDHWNKCLLSLKLWNSVIE